jgi:hypothetical protein
VLDLHARAVLIQLSQADDGVPQHGDVVDVGEQPVLAVKMTEPMPLISMAESPNDSISLVVSRVVGGYVPTLSPLASLL